MGKTEKKLKVLVTAAGGPTALGVLKCLQGKDDVALIGTDTRSHNAGCRLCGKTYLVHRMDSAQYLDDIRKIIQDEKIDAVIPTMQDEIRIYHENQVDAFVAIPQSLHYECLLDKKALYEFLKSSHPEIVPKYVAYTDNRELRRIKEEQFKDQKRICVKEISGHGGLGFAVLTDDQKLLVEAAQSGNSRIYDIDVYSQAESASEKMAMEYLEGEEYSVDVLVCRGKPAACIPRIRSRVSTGVVIEGITVKNEELIALTESIACSLVEEGFINVQFIQSKDRVSLIDLNARFCGSQVHSLGAGVNFPYMLLASHFFGEEPAAEPVWNTRMIRYWESVFFYDEMHCV